MLEIQCSLVDKKCYSCPCNGLPANSCELVLFFNRKILTSILFPTFVFVIHGHPETTTFWLTPKTADLLSSPPSTPEQGTRENMCERTRTRQQQGERNARLEIESLSTRIWTFRLIPTTFSKNKYKAKINFSQMKRDQ